LIFVQNQNVTKGIEQAEAELKESSQKKEIIDFIKNSPKGVMKGIY